MMRYLLLFLVLALVACESNAPESNKNPGSTDAEQAIRTTFEAYKAAVDAKNGEKVTALLDKETLEYYQELLQHTREADSSLLVTLPLSERLTILRLRHRLPADSLWQFERDDLVHYWIEQGLDNQNMAEVPALANIKVEGDWAEGEVPAEGQVRAVQFYFNRQGEEWKISLLNLFSMSNQILQNAFEGSDLSEKVFLTTLLERMMGEAPKEALFNAPLPRPAEK